MKNFEVLPLKEKVDIVMRAGIHLQTTQRSVFRADLYAVNDLFIEVLLFEPTLDFVYVRLVNANQLKKYLSHIHLPSNL